MRSMPFLTAVLAMLGVTSIAAGQSLLDQVEKGLDSRAPAAAAPAEGDLPAPAEESKAGYLGVGLENVASGGILVTDVAAESPAEKAGLRVDDRITAVNRAAVKDVDELGTLMEAVPPGGKLILTIDRGGKTLSITATLTERPKEPAAAAEGAGPRVDLGAPAPAETGDLPPPARSGDEPSGTGEGAPPAAASSGRATLGVTVVNFDDEARGASEVPARSGALITQVRPQSPADRAGLPVGGVIVRYEGEPIRTADQLVAAIAASHPGDEVELSYYQGNRLATKNVTLVAAGDSRLLAPGTPRIERNTGDRPLLNRVEGTLGGAPRPGAAADDPAAAAPSAASSETELREEIEKLKATIEDLEKRLAEVEATLAASRPLPDAGGAAPAEPPAGAAPAAEPAGDAPAPTLRPPARRPPTNVPKLKIGDE